MALLASGLLSGMIAVSYLGERHAHGWSPAVAVPVVIAIVALWMFFRHIKHAAYPFIAPRLIYGLGFGAINLINALYGGVTSGVIALVPLYAINRYGIDALDSGTLLIAQGAAAIMLSIAGAFALRRTGYRPPMYFGGVAIATGICCLPSTRSLVFHRMGGSPVPPSLSEWAAGRTTRRAATPDCNWHLSTPRPLLRYARCVCGLGQSSQSQ